MRESLQELHLQSIIVYVKYLFGFLTKEEYKIKIELVDRKIDGILFNYHFKI